MKKRTWKKWMAMMCASAMMTAMVLPAYAADETEYEDESDYEEGDTEAAEAEEGGETEVSAEIQDITDSMLGLWQDDSGDIYGFYSDYSFFGQWQEEETDIVGAYSLVTDGDNTALTLALPDQDPVSMFVVANTDEGMLELYNENEELTGTLTPYGQEAADTASEEDTEAADEEDAEAEDTEAAEGEVDYNVVYQSMAQNLTECYMGKTDAESDLVFATNDDGSFCSVLIIDSDNSYASLVGECSVAENVVTVTDESTGTSLEFSVTPNDDDTITMDMGEDIGTATVQKATIANAVQALKYVTENGTPLM